MLHLLVRPRSWAASLGDRQFGSATVTIALADELVAVFTRDGALVTYRDLDAQGISRRELWEAAAGAAIAATATKRGSAFLIRRAVPESASALEVAVPAGTVAAWLGHPRCFTTLHRHLEQFVPNARYFLASDRLLLAASADDPALATIRRLASEGPLPYEIRYQYGYPACRALSPVYSRSR